MSSDGRPTGFNTAEPVAQSVTGSTGDFRVADPVTGGGILTGNTDPLVVGIDPITGVSAPSGTDVGPAAFLRSAWKRAVLNGDFALPPPRTDWPINSDPSSNVYNPLPGWVFTDNSNGAIVLTWVADTGSGSGGALFWSIGPGAAADAAYIEQKVPIRSTRTQNNAFQGVSSWFSATNDANPLVTMEAVALKSDAVTTTGTTATRTSAFSTTLTVPDVLFFPTSLPSLPADADRVRLRIGVQRNTGPAGSSYSVQTSEMLLVEGAPITVWPDMGSPGTRAFEAFNYGQILSFYRDNSGTARFYIDDTGAVPVVGTLGHLVASSSVRVLQVTPIANPPANYVGIWADQSAANALRVTTDTGLHNIGATQFLVDEGSVPATPPSGTHAVFATAAGNLRSINDIAYQGSVHTVGFAPYAYPIAFPENDPIASTTNLTAVVAGLGGARAAPIAVQAPMQVDSISIWSKDTASLRTAEWRLYLDSGSGSNTLGNITGCSGTFSFTPGAASLRTSAAATPGTWIAPGVYWLVIRNTSTAQTFGIGVASVGVFLTNMNRANAAGAAALGTSIDLSAYTSPTSHIAIRLEGRIGAETGPL